MVVCVLNVYKNSNRAIKIQFISDALNMIFILVYIQTNGLVTFLTFYDSKN